MSKQQFSARSMGRQVIYDEVIAGYILAAKVSTVDRILFEVQAVTINSILIEPGSCMYFPIFQFDKTVNRMIGINDCFWPTKAQYANYLKIKQGI